MSNIDEFNRLKLQILDALFETFPSHAVITIQDLYEKVDEAAMANLDGTMVFLRDEGFVKYSTAAEGQIFVGVQLTMRGLGILNETPGSLENGPTMGTRIKSALATGTKEAFKEAVKFLVSEGMKGHLS